MTRIYTGPDAPLVGADVFIAEYGVTPYEPVMLALADGKVVMCKYKGYEDSRGFALLTHTNDDTTYMRFAMVVNDKIARFFSLDENNRWDTWVENFATMDDLDYELAAVNDRIDEVEANAVTHGQLDEALYGEGGTMEEPTGGVYAPLTGMMEMMDETGQAIGNIENRLNKLGDSVILDIDTPDVENNIALYAMLNDGKDVKITVKWEGVLYQVVRIEKSEVNRFQLFIYGLKLMGSTLMQYSFYLMENGTTTLGSGYLVGSMLLNQHDTVHAVNIASGAVTEDKLDNNLKAGMKSYYLIADDFQSITITPGMELFHILMEGKFPNIVVEAFGGANILRITEVQHFSGLIKMSTSWLEGVTQNDVRKLRRIYFFLYPEGVCETREEFISLS